MLLKECEQYGATIYLNTVIEQIQKTNDYSFKISTTKGRFHCHSVVIATGGLSIPTMGASPLPIKLQSSSILRYGQPGQALYRLRWMSSKRIDYPSCRE